MPGKRHTIKVRADVKALLQDASVLTSYSQTEIIEALVRSHLADFIKEHIDDRAWDQDRARNVARMVNRQEPEDDFDRDEVDDEGLDDVAEEQAAPGLLARLFGRR